MPAQLKSSPFLVVKATKLSPSPLWGGVRGGGVTALEPIKEAISDSLSIKGEMAGGPEGGDAGMGADAQ